MKHMSKKKFVYIFLLLSLTLMFAESKLKTVYITPTGKKYHTATCRTLSKTKNIIPIDIEEAKEKGYTACKVCNP